MPLHLKQSIRNELVEAIRDHLNISGTVRFNFYKGTMPANADITPDYDNWLGSADGVVYGTVTDGKMSLTGTPLAYTPSGTTTGNATWFEYQDVDNAVVVFRGTVGTSGADMIVDTVAMGGGAPINIISADIQIVA